MQAPRPQETPPPLGGFRADFMRVSDWIDQMRTLLAEMEELWWWQSGLRRRGPLQALRLLPGNPLPAEAAARAHALAAPRQAEVLDSPRPLKGSEAARTMAEMCALLLTLDQEARRMAATPWWRLGILARAAAGRLGMKKRAFRMPTEDMAEIMGQFRIWRAGTDLDNKYGVEPAHPDPGPTPRANPGALFYRIMDRLLAESGSVTLPHAWRDGEARAAALRDGADPWTEETAPLVSVIMPAWNRASVMGEAVQSVLDQTWTRWELLVCDDGGEDGTEEAVAGFGDGRIRCLRLKHGGAARARNAGLAEARGSLIAYLDTDNLWHPAYLETMAAALRGRGPRCAFARTVDMTQTADGAPRLRSARMLEHDYGRLRLKNYLDLNAFVHHRALYECLGGFTENLPKGQDWDLALRYTHAADPLKVDALLALYRRNAEWQQLTDTQAHRTGFVEAVVRSNVAKLDRNGAAGGASAHPPRVLFVGGGGRARLLAKALERHKLAETGMVEQLSGPPGAHWDVFYYIGGPPPGDLFGQMKNPPLVLVEDAPAPLDCQDHIQPTTRLVLPGFSEGPAFPVGGACDEEKWTPEPAGRAGGSVRVLSPELFGGAKQLPLEAALRLLDLPNGWLVLPSETDGNTSGSLLPQKDTLASSHAMVFGLAGENIEPLPVPFLHAAAVRAFALGIPVIAPWGGPFDGLIQRGCARGVRPGDHAALRETLLEAASRTLDTDDTLRAARDLFVRQASCRAAAAHIQWLLAAFSRKNAPA